MSTHAENLLFIEISRYHCCCYAQDNVCLGLISFSLTMLWKKIRCCLTRTSFYGNGMGILFSGRTLLSSKLYLGPFQFLKSVQYNSRMMRDYFDPSYLIVKTVTVLIAWRARSRFCFGSNESRQITPFSFKRK